MSDSARSQAFALLLVGVIVASTLASPLLIPTGVNNDGLQTENVSPVQSASAQQQEPRCTLSQYLSIGGPGAYGDGCDVVFNAGVDSEIDHLQAYQKGLSKIAAKETFLTVMSNYAKDTEDVGFLIGELAVYEALENGSSASLAKSKARVEVQKYYQTKKFNYLDFWNQYVTSAKNIDDTVDAALYYPVSASTAPSSDGVNYPDDFNGFVGFDTQTVNFEKINKSITLKQPKIKWTYYSGSTFTASAQWDPKNLKSGSNTYVIDNFQFNIRPPSTDDGNQRRYLGSNNWDGYQDLEQVESEVLADISSFVNNTYAEFEAGNLDNEDALSQVNILNNLIADVDSQNGSFDEVTSFLAATGMATPDLDNTSYMDIRYQPYSDDGQSLKVNRTLEGLIASTTEPPTGSWKVNQTYNTDNLDGSQSVAKLTGGLQSLDGEFEITNVYNENGEDAGDVNITTENRDYSVSNTTELQKRTQELQDEIDRLQKLQTTTIVTGGESAGAGFVEGIANALGNLVGDLFGGLVPGLPGKNLPQIIIAGVIVILGVRVLIG